MKKITISRTYLLFSLAICLAASGCKSDWLDRKPQGQYTEEDIPAGSLDGLVKAAYGGLRHGGISGLPYIAVHNIRSDDAIKGSSVTDGADAEVYFDNFQYTTNFWLLNDYWTGQYNLINLANNVIHAADSTGESTPEGLAYVGEAKFLRAFAYFNLVRAFGEVPLIDFKVVNASDAILPKSTVDEVYQLIDSDLLEAIAVLPSEKDWGGQFPGRISQWTAYALQAKTFLARSQWGNALSAAEMVVSSGQYDLSVPYDRIFTEAEENSKESVFEIQAIYNQGQTDLGLSYANVQGVRGAGDWDLGWGWNVPNERLENAFEEGDSRKDVTLLYTGQTNAPYGETLPAGLDRPYWNKKIYTNPAIRRSTGSRFGQWLNMRVIRYADVVLMAAEAANEVGGDANIDKALDYLEQVRARARGGNSAVLPEVTTRDQAQLRAALRHERQVELGMENERFFDLVRWGIDVQTMHDAGKTGYQIRNRFLPIPQQEIDRSGGVLIQNPNY